MFSIKRVHLSLETNKTTTVNPKSQYVDNIFDLTVDEELDLANDEEFDLSQLDNMSTDEFNYYVDMYCLQHPRFNSLWTIAKNKTPSQYKIVKDICMVKNFQVLEEKGYVIKTEKKRKNGHYNRKCL